MEIEAKFAVPDEATLNRLAQADQLASYALGAAVTKRMYDVFLDTPDRKVIRSGYVCRQRDFGDHVEMTLKSGHVVEGAVHTRRELMLDLPRALPVRDWPAGEFRSIVLALIGNDDLQPLFDQHQVRVVRPLSNADRIVAEFSADRVELAHDDRRRLYFEVEVELKDAGTLADLDQIAACLQNEWGLQPEARSKFERALEFSSETDPD